MRGGALPGHLMQVCGEVDDPGKVHGQRIWWFPKIRGTLLGAPIIKTILFGGLYWGPLLWEMTIWRGPAPTPAEEGTVPGDEFVDGDRQCQG